MRPITTLLASARTVIDLSVFLESNGKFSTAEIQVHFNFNVNRVLRGAAAWTLAVYFWFHPGGDDQHISFSSP